MSLQELERDILNLPPDERARLAEWLNSLPSNGLPPNGTDAPQYPAQAQEEMPEGYRGSPQHKADVAAINEGFQAFEEGQYSAWAEVDARMQAKYNISPGAKPLSPEELEALP